ncbi:hypothetical protein RJ640_005287, partial [Escallonia rubra]
MLTEWCRRRCFSRAVVAHICTNSGGAAVGRDRDVVGLAGATSGSDVRVLDGERRWGSRSSPLVAAIGLWLLFDGVAVGGSAIWLLPAGGSFLENEAAAATKDQHVIDPILGLLVDDLVQNLFSAVQSGMTYSFDMSSENEIHTSDPRSLKLQFYNKISSPVLTGEKIQGGGGASITVAVVDCLTEQVVKSGPEALAEVELLVLKGDPDIFSGVDWTSEVFEKKIVREVVGKKNLLQGSLRLNLEEGVGSVGEIHFTHNRNWFQNCQFRLGARVVNNDLGIRVKEAKTDPFEVKDRRNIYDKKRFPPSLSDEVCRLKTIARKGKYYQRLSGANINTVQDFLTSFNTDPQTLQQILGPGAKLKVPVDHARTCNVTDKIYLYNSPNLAPNTGVVFNDVGQ